MSYTTYCLRFKFDFPISNLNISRVTSYICMMIKIHKRRELFFFWLIFGRNSNILFQLIAHCSNRNNDWTEIMPHWIRRLLFYLNIFWLYLYLEKFFLIGGDGSREFQRWKKKQEMAKSLREYENYMRILYRTMKIMTRIKQNKIILDLLYRLAF